MAWGKVPLAGCVMCDFQSSVLVYEANLLLLIAFQETECNRVLVLADMVR